MPKRGKRYLNLLEKYDRTKVYTPEEAVRVVKDLASAKFDETVEVHIKLGIDPKKSDQTVRSTVSLPHGTGKQVRVVAIAKGEKLKEAEEAGADYVGGEELVKKIKEGWLDFDAVVATPDMMGIVGRELGRVLGPRGLLPNPKAGTVGFNIGEIIKEIKAGRIEFRNDKTAARRASSRKSSPTTSAPSSRRWRRPSPRRPRAPTSRASTSPPPWGPRSRSSTPSRSVSVLTPSHLPRAYYIALAPRCGRVPRQAARDSGGR